MPEARLNRRQERAISNVPTGALFLILPPRPGVETPGYCQASLLNAFLSFLDSVDGDAHKHDSPGRVPGCHIFEMVDARSTASAWRYRPTRRLARAAARGWTAWSEPKSGRWAAVR